MDIINDKLLSAYSNYEKATNRLRAASIETIKEFIRKESPYTRTLDFSLIGGIRIYPNPIVSLSIDSKGQLNADYAIAPPDITVAHAPECAIDILQATAIVEKIQDIIYDPVNGYDIVGGVIKPMEKNDNE